MVIHLIMGNQTYGNARLNKHGTMMNNAMALSENGVQQILIDDCLSSLTQFHYRYIYIYTFGSQRGVYPYITFSDIPPWKTNGKTMEKTVQYSEWLDGDIQQRHIAIQSL